MTNLVEEIVKDFQEQLDELESMADTCAEEKDYKRAQQFQLEANATRRLLDDIKERITEDRVKRSNLVVLSA